MLDPLYTAVSWVMLRWYWVLTHIGFSKDSGLTWALSIVLLVVTARLLMFRLFLKQVHYQRRMQELQPKLTAIREKYKNDRQAMQREMMAFQQAEGFNPLAGCLPMLVQMPIFLSLFHVLRHLSHSVRPLYSWTAEQTLSAHDAKLWGAPISASFNDSAAKIADLGGTVGDTRAVILPLLVVSAAATYLSQRFAMSRAVTAPTGTAATVQKLMLYIIPLGVLASGLLFNFPLGVLLYWFTSNTWTLLQQLYINRVHPPVSPTAGAPVGEAGKALAPKPGARPVRDARRGAGAGAAGSAGSGRSGSGRAGGSGAVVSDEPGQGATGGAAGDSGGSGTAGSGSVSGRDAVPRTPPRPGARPANRPGARTNAKPANRAKKRR